MESTGIGKQWRINWFLVKNSSMGRHKRLWVDASSKTFENQRSGESLHRCIESCIDSCGQNWSYASTHTCYASTHTCYASTHTEPILKNAEFLTVCIDAYILWVDASKLCIDTWGFVSIHTVLGQNMIFLKTVSVISLRL